MKFVPCAEYIPLTARDRKSIPFFLQTSDYNHFYENVKRIHCFAKGLSFQVNIIREKTQCECCVDWGKKVPCDSRYRFEQNRVHIHTMMRTVAFGGHSGWVSVSAKEREHVKNGAKCKNSKTPKQWNKEPNIKTFVSDMNRNFLCCLVLTCLVACTRKTDTN